MACPRRIPGAEVSRTVSAFVMMLLLLCGIARADTGIDSWTALQGAINSAESGDTIVLTGDVTAGESDTALVIPNGMTIMLDLNGFTLDRNLDTTAFKSGAVISVDSGAVLTIMDSGKTSTGSITGGIASDGGGIRNSGTLILEGGRVTGNRASTAGGGIVNYGVLVVTGGTVTGNTAGKWGGGIYNTMAGYLTVDCDIVVGNSAPRDENIRNVGSMKIVGGDTVDFAAITDYLDLLAVLPVLMMLLLLTFTIHVDKYMDKRQKRTMFVICALVFTLILQNFLENRLSLAKNGILLRTLASIYGYSVRPAILAMFLCLVWPGRRYRPVWVLIGVNAAIYLTALFSPLTFSFSVNGHFNGGPLNQTCLIVSAMLFAYLFYLTVRVFHSRQRRETWIPIIVTVIIGTSVALDYSVEYNGQPVSFLTIAIVISCVFYYVWLHLQFVREHEEALRADQRIQIMMSQIQPHFLFNTLSTIQALCTKEPSTAIYAIERFGVYLRRNIEVLKQTSLIPLAKELEHTRAYTEIEALRFSNIHVDYDIRETDIQVPALSIQPLVENAIRHGVRGRKEGVVTVTTRRVGSEDQIIIRDNGKGFDASSVKGGDGTHIGIANVRSRLEQLCSGSLEIDSRIGEGTMITMRIPIAQSRKR